MNNKTEAAVRGPAGAFAGSERNFAVNLMQHLVVPTFVLDADCRVIIWNKACERLTGLPAVEVLGTSEHWRGFYPEPRPCLADLVAQGRTMDIAALYSAHGDTSGLNPSIHAENWCVMPRVGGELYLAIDVGPIYDEAGHLLAVVETLRDMTEYKRARMALEHLATMDGLTGVSNRRNLDHKLDHEWKRARRDGLPVAVAMIDVDHFKRYNDAYGHLQGDACLRALAEALARAAYRPGDLVARYGGEEFVIVMPTTDLEGAETVADRIQEEVAALEIPHSEGESGRVTLSIGVAALVPEPGMEVTQLIAAADAALYRAKHGGRNCVVRAAAAG